MRPNRSARSRETSNIAKEHGDFASCPSSKRGFLSSSRASDDEKNCSNCDAQPACLGFLLLPGQADPRGRGEQLNDLCLERADARVADGRLARANAIDRAYDLILGAKDGRGHHGFDATQAIQEVGPTTHFDKRFGVRSKPGSESFG